MTARTRIPAAAPAWVRSVVAGRERAARVVHQGVDAVYLEVDGSCLGVLSAAATAVPCAARTTLPRLSQDLLGGDLARVGDGRLALGGADVVVVRTVDASVPRLGPSEVAVAGRRLGGTVGNRVDHVRAELPAEAVEALAAGDPGAVPTLLGRGSGLTPVGDDVLAGWVATEVAASARTSDETPVGAAVALHASAATTLLSATLLACARRGDVIPEFRSLLLALTDPDGPVDDSVDALLEVGHTSGAGLVLGTLLALRHLSSRSSS